MHGCKQSVEDFAESTRLVELGEREKAIILFPSQSKERNSSLCWNWFLAVNQMRNWGEPLMIAAATNTAVRSLPVDPKRIFILGLSAGGAMANMVASCYPELFSAVGIHSGVAFAAASTSWSAGPVLAEGPSANG